MSKPATNANDKPALLFLFASAFFWFGILFIWVLINEGDILYNLIPFAISAIITLAGFFFYLVWIYRTILISLHNKLLFNPDSFTTTARFISTIESSHTAVNDRVTIFETVTYEYDDENGVHREVKSILSLLPEQAEYLKQKQTFKIRCKGKISAIIEDIPGRDIYYNE